jgi:hypothetical protein
MFVVALKRAGFAGSRSRTALWEIPTVFLIEASQLLITFHYSPKQLILRSRVLDEHALTPYTL